MPGPDLPVRTSKPDADADARKQDSAGAGRGVGLGISTLLGAILILVPVVWAVVYMAQAGTAGLGFVFVTGIVLLGCVGFGFVLLRGMLRS